MDLQRFYALRPYLYHLTAADNAANIIKTQTLLSTNAILDISGKPEDILVKRQRRAGHLAVATENFTYHIRDQRPISEIALAKCLTNSWKIPDYLEHLNDRVFMWPTLNRLWKHFKRYERETPVILRFKTEEVVASNPHVKFSRLNSGATRANTSWGGRPPERGLETFQPADKYSLGIGTVVEVTFEKQALLAGCEISTSSRPDGPFISVG